MLWNSDCTISEEIRFGFLEAENIKFPSVSINAGKWNWKRKKKTDGRRISGVKEREMGVKRGRGRRVPRSFSRVEWEGKTWQKRLFQFTFIFRSEWWF